jgi:multiple sugar transport system permease protein
MKGRRRSLRTWIEIGLLALLAVAMLFPVVWMLETSLKDGRDIYAVPAKIIGFDVTLDHYKDVFVQRGGSGASDLAVSFKNSVLVAGFSTLLATLLGVPAAWAYSRFTLKASKDQLFFILSTRFMPPVVVVIPIFLMYRDLDLIDTKLGLVLIYAAFNLPFTIWMMKGFVDEVPAEYEDAAMLDGYSRFEAFWRFTLPLLVPGIAATAVFALIFSWNEFVFAIFLTSSESARTAPPAIAGLVGGTTIDWGLVAASAMVFAAPVLLFAFLVRKHLVAGVTLGAVRRGWPRSRSGRCTSASATARSRSNGSTSRSATASCS